MNPFRLRLGGFVSLVVLLTLALISGMPAHPVKAVPIDYPTSTPGGVPAVNMNCISGCEGSTGSPQPVSIVSPNPLNVNIANSPAPIAIPSAPATPPATVPITYSIGGCMAEATPAPTAGTTVADQCNANGHKIIAIEPNTSVSFSGLCNKSAIISTAASGAYYELVAASGSTKVYVCSFSVVSAGTVNVKFATGTKVSTACDTGEADLTGAYPLIANSGLNMSGGLTQLFTGAASGELCINTSGSVSVFGFISYAQQ